MRHFSVSWDYRCPFARNAHAHVLAGLAAGADWDVTFVPFALGQAHVEPGQPPIWDRPDHDSGLLALQVGVTVRDTRPDAFLAVHGALFSGRHDHGLDLRDRDALAKVLLDHGVDADEVLTAVDDGSALATVRSEHEASVAEHDVWGVPTFVHDGAAAFVRLLDRPGDDPDHAVATIERVVDLLAVPNLNEFKHTTVPF